MYLDIKVFFYYFGEYFFETGFSLCYVVLAVLDLCRPWWTHIVCLCLLSFGMKSVHYHHPMGLDRTWTGYLLLSGKTSSEDIGTPSQPQNLWPTICPSYKICWDKGCAEIVGVANQWLFQLETHTMRGSSSLIDQDPEAGYSRDLGQNQQEWGVGGQWNDS